MEASSTQLIADIKWVNLIQIVPKKIGVIVIRNDNCEMVSARTSTSQHMCIDYWKLNKVTKETIFHCHLQTKFQRVAGMNNTVLQMTIPRTIKQKLSQKIRRKLLSAATLVPSLLKKCHLDYTMPHYFPIKHDQYFH